MYMSTGQVGIPNFQENVMQETRKIFISNGCTFCQTTSIQQILDLPSLRMNIEGCLNAIQAELNQRKSYYAKYMYAQQKLYNQPYHIFCRSEILYTKQGRNFKVSDLLAVLKYSINIAEVIEPSNQNYEQANAALTVLQGIEATLNNRPKDKPINKMLHLATSFMSSVVKSSLDNVQAKRDVTISAIMIDLAIDFFCGR